ncbi:MAG: hypothetical protein ACJAQ4_001305 [Cryomorphaceae bacterium]|jgi:hypothetical protein
MKRILLILSLVFTLGFSNSSQGQIRVFAGNANYITDQVLHFTNNRIFPAYTFDFNAVLYTVIRDKIMVGGSGSEFDLIYTYRDGRIYTGNAMYSGQIAFTFGENGKIYKGDSNFELDVLYTVQNGIIYVGSGTFAGDAIYFIEGRYSPADLFGILLSLDLIS